MNVVDASPPEITHDLLIHTTVLLGVLAHGTTKLLLGAVETLVKVVFVARVGRLLGCVSGNVVHYCG
jgi:hypothetical protein